MMRRDATASGSHRCTSPIALNAGNCSLQPVGFIPQPSGTKKKNQMKVRHTRSAPAISKIVFNSSSVLRDYTRKSETLSYALKL